MVEPGGVGERKVDEAEGFAAPGVAGAELRVVVDEGNELEVGAVGEEYEFVFGAAVEVAPAGGDGEVCCEPGRGVEEGGVREEEDNVVDLGGHRGVAGVWAASWGIGLGAGGLSWELGD